MIRGEVAKTELISTLGRRFEIVKKDAFLTLSDGTHHRLERYGLSTGSAISIVPYFKHPKTAEWMAVLVSQYRPMVNETCLEAPGSLIDSDLSPEEQMVKTVRAETGIIIPQNCIRLVGAKWLANSFADQKVWLGSIELSIPDFELFEGNLTGRSDATGEYEVNEVVLYSLAYLIKHLDLRVNYSLLSYQLLELGFHLNLLIMSGSPNAQETS